MRRNKVQDLRVSGFMSTDLVTVGPDDTIGDILGKMKSRDIHEVPVLERKKLLGVVTMRELMRRRNLPPSTKASNVLQVAPHVAPDTTLPEVAEAMISAGFRAIPVVRAKGLVGILSRSDLVRALDETRALEGVVARDFMTPNPPCVGEDDTVEQAVPREPPRARRAVRRDRRPRGRSEGHVRRDLRGRPEGDAANRAARAAADPRDPPPEVQARGGPLEVLPPRPVHDEPPDLLRAPLRLGPARRPERHAR